MKRQINMRILAGGLLILCQSLLWSKPVPIQTARNVAVNHINKNNQVNALHRWQKGLTPQAAAKPIVGQIAQTHTIQKNGVAVYYAFNLSTEGWVIVSADDAASPVIGYSNIGSFDPNTATQPPAFTAWMENAAVQIANAAALGSKPLPQTESAWDQLDTAPEDFQPDFGVLAETDSVEPLIQSTWGQGNTSELWDWEDNNSYNKYCPWDYTTFLYTHWQTCPTGCVATAMAQIMRYWQWPPFGQGRHGYNPTNHCTYDCSSWGWREVNFFAASYDWSDMPLNGPSNETALLMRDIGVAVEMEYNLSGSLSSVEYKAPPVFYNYFRYASCYYRARSSYQSNWTNLLVNELNLNRPILYRSRDDNAGGHAFICDGYDASGNFHFNWGWNGSYDGWFRVSDLTPGSYDFSWSGYQGAVFGIVPVTTTAIYVDDDYYEGGTNDGHTWGINAFYTIQDAMLIVSEGGTIYVNPGAYYGAIDFMGKPIHLLAVDGPGSAAIYGNGAKHVIQCVNGEGPDTIIEGFTITGGNANGSSNMDKCGGGMLNSSSSPTVINCGFYDNFATLHGGGMHNENSSPKVINCYFSANHSGAHGGGLMNNSYSVSAVTNCEFSSNTAGSGGGGVGNSWYSTVNLVNCSFTENTAATGGGIYSYYSTVTAANCIFWADTNNEIVHNGGSIAVTYSDIQGGYSGAGNINADPQFNYLLGGCSLGSNSPCLDAGNNAAVPADILTGIDGQPRFIDSCRPDTGSGTPPIVDMGVYESTYTWKMPVNQLGDPGFEYGDTSTWITNGDSLTAVTEQIHEGSYSGLVSNRTASSQGAGRTLYFNMDNSTTYRISGWVKLQNAAADSVTLTFTYVDLTGTHNHSIDQATVYNDQWILLDGALALNASGPITEKHLYFTGPAAGVNFYIDDVAVTVLASDIDHSGSVDLFDFDLFARYYQRDCATQDCGPADLEQCDNAETVNEHDLSIIINDWLVGAQ